MTRSSKLVAMLSLAGLAACSSRPPAPGSASPAPAVAPTAAPTPSPVAAAAPSGELPLDPVRAEAAAASRKALALMARAIACPQKPPSALAKYCAVDAAFADGHAAEVPEGTTLILPGVLAIIQPGPASFSTLGTSMPTLLALRRANGRLLAKRAVLRDAGERDALEQLLGRIGGALDGRWDHVDVPASFAPQVAALTDGELDPFERSGDSWWPVDLDGLELRRAGDHWMAVGTPEGPNGRHVVSIFADRLKVLGAKEKSPQTIRVLHLK